MGRPETKAGTGCEIHNDCITCPLPECIYDIPGINKPALKKKIEAWKLASEGYTVKQIADRFGMSIRQIQRYLKEVIK